SMLASVCSRTCFGAATATATTTSSKVAPSAFEIHVRIIKPSPVGPARLPRRRMAQSAKQETRHRGSTLPCSGSAFAQRRQQPEAGPDHLQFAAGERVVAGPVVFLEPRRTRVRPGKVALPFAVGDRLVLPVVEIDRHPDRPE